MARDIPNVMTHAQAVAQFDEVIIPFVVEAYEQDGIPDTIARCQEWINWTDSLCKDRQISDWQYENWSQPDSCEG
jgi:hypothetical protein